MSAAPGLAQPPRYLAWLPSFLFRPDGVPERYIAKAWALSLLPCFVLSGLVHLLLPGLRGPTLPLSDHVFLFSFLLVVASPAIETLVLLPIVLILQRWVGSGPAVVGSALLWGLAHSLSAPRWGFVAWWPFLIMSIALLTWRSEGVAKAVAVVTAIHALQNGSVLLVLLLLGV